MKRFEAEPDLEELLDAFEAWVFKHFRTNRRGRRSDRLEIVRLLRDLNRPLSREQALAVATSDVDAYLGRAVSSLTAHRGSLHLDRFFSFCLEEGLVASKPIEGTLPHPPSARAASVATLTVEQLSRFFAAADQPGPRHHALRDTAILRLLYTEMLFPAELATLTIGDLVHGGIRLRRSKGGQVELSAETEKAIRAYLAARGSSDPSQGLFPGLGGTALTSIGIGTILRRVARRAGIHITLQILRETRRLSLLDGGATHSEIQAKARLAAPPVLGRHQGVIDYDRMVAQFRLLHPRYESAAH